jgi:hypothetical protein
MKKYWSRLLTRFGYSSTGFVFISDSAECPCAKAYELVKEEGSIGVVRFVNPDSPEESTEIAKMNRFKNLVVFMHGDEARKRFFYLRYDTVGQRNFPASIRDEWLAIFRKKDRNIYFHVCNGADILRRNPTIKPLIDNWVAHQDIVYGFHSTHPKIRALRKKFFRVVHRMTTDRVSPRSLESAVLAANYEIKADLTDLSKQHDPGKNCNKDYVLHIITTIGKNIRSLSTSEN